MTVAASLMLKTVLIPLVVLATIVAWASRGVAVDYPHRAIGMCNVVTLIRAAIVAFLAGAAFDPSASQWLFFSLAALALALDGVDGWLARRSGLASAFGARFDMETDAALAAVLALALMLRGTAGAEILVLGFARYAFVAAGLGFPALQAPLPEMFRRKLICVLQIGTLVVLSFPLTPEAVVTPLSLTAAALLIWSFVIDVLWLCRRAS
ncbi:MAG: CDP-alcohol phosphatidyltransferase family protein [Pseudomonadota bacterium]